MSATTKDQKIHGSVATSRQKDKPVTQLGFIFRCQLEDARLRHTIIIIQIDTAQLLQGDKLCYASVRFGIIGFQIKSRFRLFRWTGTFRA